jgi:hypothetical protein
MDLRIVNPDPKYSTVTLIPPTPLSVQRPRFNGIG